MNSERPNCVVMERSCVDESDIKLKRESAMKSLVSQLPSAEDEKVTQSSGTFREQWEETQKITKLVKELKMRSILQLSIQYLKPTDMRNFSCTGTIAGHSIDLAGNYNTLIKDARQQLRDLQTFGSRASHKFVVTTGTSMQKNSNLGISVSLSHSFSNTAQVCLTCQSGLLNHGTGVMQTLHE